MKIKRWLHGLLFSSILFSFSVYADGSSCTFKIINHENPSFESLIAKGSIGNLAIPSCTRQANDDEITKAVCSQNPENTLFTHPHMESTCEATNGQMVFLQFEANTSKICGSKMPQHTQYHDIVLNYPEDFYCWDSEG